MDDFRSTKHHYVLRATAIARVSLSVLGALQRARFRELLVLYAVSVPSSTPDRGASVSLLRTELVLSELVGSGSGSSAWWYVARGTWYVARGTWYLVGVGGSCSATGALLGATYYVLGSGVWLRRGGVWRRAWGEV